MSMPGGVASLSSIANVLVQTSVLRHRLAEPFNFVSEVQHAMPEINDHQIIS
jgi:hypothetical protein